MQKAAPYSSTRTRQLVITSMSIALVLITTLLVKIQLPIAPNGGFVHLGTAMLFLIAILFGPRTAMIAGAVGMGLYDILTGFMIWFPGTFIARGLQGLIVGWIAWSGGRNGNNVKFNLIGMILSVPVMLAVYFVHEGIAFSSWTAPVGSIPGNLIQNVVGILVAIPVGIALKKTRFFRQRG